MHSCSFVKMGHHPVKAQDTPGFIINHAGRAFGSEAYAMLIENVASVSELDRIYRDGIGFKMGPFELVDLTGMDVSHPVSESIYHQYYEEARYRPSVITRQRYIAKQLGRKTGKGFMTIRLVSRGEDPAVFVEKLDQYPTVWIAADLEKDQSILKIIWNSRA